MPNGNQNRVGMPDADACGGAPESFDVCFTGDRRRRLGSHVDYCPDQTGYYGLGFVDGVGRQNDGGPDDAGDYSSFDNGPCFMG